VTWQSPRLGLLAGRDPESAALVGHLIDIAKEVLPQTYANGEFVFTLNGSRGPNGVWQVRPSGTSLRYSAMTVLGLLRLPDPLQRSVLDGETAHDLIARLAKRLDEISDVGDAALVCWAAAEAGHAKLPHALRRLAELAEHDGTRGHVVESAWEVSALVAARPHADVEEPLARARARLLAARPGRLYSHTTGRGGAWFRAHVGSFAAQVYPVQALARLHRSADDQEALAVANSVAATICTAQGEAGQWWWHYDARTGGVVEGYPVYSVHQHSMGPMALLDLAEAGGEQHLDAICRGLRWLVGPAESTEPLVLDDPPITWRKVARNDYRKLTRGLRAATTSITPSLRLSVLDRVFPPGVVDHECRPYELGWLLMTWLS
jgi:hypothetical protein